MQMLEDHSHLTTDQQELLTISLTGGRTLLTMINGLLDVDKMESGSMVLQYTRQRPSELISVAVAQVSPLAEGNGLAVNLEIGEDLPTFVGDEDLLRRTLVNLLGNAIKFTPTGGTVSIGVRAHEDPRTLLFSVSDTGEGIPVEAFQHIFEKFGQVASRLAGRSLSTGLGLAFCKLAVEAHGGVISIESVTGKGSTFSFTIPVDDERLAA